MPQDPLATVAAAKAALAAKQVSAVELVQACLTRIGADPTGSFITVCEEEALVAAADADAAIAAGGQRDLIGVPIAHKDIFCTEGVHTTCASRMLANFVAPYDATVVAKLKTAGAVLLGKTNMDEFGMGSSTETSHFGPTRNPWDLGRVPGGSSGGSAAAVAAGLAPAATGTDTGGSVRQPAAFCGVSGLKPTYGRVSRFGLVAFASSLDQPGPMARSAADLRLLLGHMEGRDPRDSTSAAAKPTARRHRAERLTIGVPSEYWEGLDSDIATPVAAALEAFERLGHRRRAIALPHTKLAAPVYYVIACAEASTNLARYDGVRYGHRADEADSFDALHKRSRGEGFGAEVKRRILAGTYALSVGRHDAYYRQAQRVRRLIREDFLGAFQEVDVILTPTAPNAAFPLAGSGAGHAGGFGQNALTAPASLAGVPALSIPCGATPDALPVGMQLIAPHFGEDRLLALGEAFQQETDWHLRAPPAAA